MSDVCPTETAVAARGLRKRLGEEWILDGVDLTVDPNEIVMFMGPNGAGKTVLLCCLAGGLTPTAGRVSIFGGEPGRAGADLSFLLQDSLALPELTARENLAFYRRLHPRATDRWQDLVETLGLADALDGKPLRHFSGGMRRKLEFAIALSADVPLYVLDEPTANLDPPTVRLLHDLITAERRRGKTVVMTSHTPLDAQIADRVVFVQGGTVTVAGAPAALLERVPPVVRIRGRVRDVADAVTPLLRGGRLFERGDEARGFLEPGVGLEEIEARLPSGSTGSLLSRDEPAYADLFNFYTHVHDRPD